MGTTAHDQPRSMKEIRALVAANLARFDTLADLWDELTDAQQATLVEVAAGMAKENE